MRYALCYNIRDLGWQRGVVVNGVRLINEVNQHHAL